ncbi:hypothetical protein [Gorillibacterium sp. CAU 1737]|uniref:hypothetical protein n=1 Tax=Gorillibacterium sp. CAU 1737 TaxID=3140362 RepID=UPI003260A81B
MEEADLTGLTSAELMIIIANVEDLEEVADALTELSRRDPQMAASCCFQPYGESLSSEFLTAVETRYLALRDADRMHIQENYEWFKKSFEGRL